MLYHLLNKNDVRRVNNELAQKKILNKALIYTSEIGVWIMENFQKIKHHRQSKSYLKYYGNYVWIKISAKCSPRLRMHTFILWHLFSITLQRQSSSAMSHTFISEYSFFLAFGQMRIHELLMKSQCTCKEWLFGAVYGLR